MPEEKDGGQPQADAFGELPPQKEEAPKVEDKKEEGDKGGEGEGKEKLTPTQQVAELSRKLGEYAEKERSWGETQKSKDDNIRAMKDSIKRLEDKIKGGKGEGEEKGEELFKDIKTSKDLTAEQKEEMTDTEIKQMDEIAALKQGMNNLAGMIKKGGEKGDGGQLDVNNIVRETAKELAKGDKDTANLIIASVKKFNLEGLSEEEITARVGEAALLVPTYKKPKEQVSGKGGKAAGGGNDTDPYGVDKIVDEVHAKKENKGFEL